ncbi:MAG: SecDF P1 head subdomain-containing protein [Acidimicrobiales bacterium]
MTVVDSPPAPEVVDEAQLLFHEAKQRRRRRRIVTGIVSAVVVVLVVATLSLTAGHGGGTPSTAPAAPPPVTGAGASAAVFSLRPVLCYAPPLAVEAGQATATGPLPVCSPSSALTTANLNVAPDSGDMNGYTSNSNLRADSRFAAYPSTPAADDQGSDTVLLPGSGAAGGQRYVLGPATVTGSDVASAHASMQSGQWVIVVDLNGHGATKWDSLAQEQFHALVGVVVNGTVVSAPIVQPTQASFSSFDGQVEIAGAFTGPQAKAIAARL